MRIAGTTAGLGFGFDGHWRNPVEVIPWTEVEAISRAVPDEARRQLVEFWPRRREHQVAYPRFVTSADAIGVLPAWEEKWAAFEAKRPSSHAGALSVDVDSEAGDLLDLLEDQKVNGYGRAVSPPVGWCIGGQLRAVLHGEAVA